jgi:hypothetical protein
LQALALRGQTGSAALCGDNRILTDMLEIGIRLNANKFTLLAAISLL